MTRLLVLSAVGLMLVLVLRGDAVVKDSPTFSVYFDAGSDHPSTDHRGRLYLADQEWTSQTPSGYIGGYRVWSGREHPVDGTPDEFLHTNQRHGWEEYRFSNIPAGDYLVTLSFSEIGIPAYTVFDVAIEGRPVLENLGISDHVGGNYALTRRFAVSVMDGELNVTSRPIAGEPRLAAIEVEGRPRDVVAPATPAGLVTTSSYHAVLLDWADNAADDLDGYHVYRATLPSGPHTRLTAEPVYVSHYQDASASLHVTYHYCISAIDVYGNESGLTSCPTGFALGESDAKLPLYALQVPPENLLDLYNHIFSDDEVSGSFTYRDQTFPVNVRYRGGYGRFVHKKSWKIMFPNGSPFPGRDQINLRADYADQTLMHTKLATALFEAGGVQLPEAEHVLLTLNGEYLGVYTFNEQVDEGYLERTGQNPNASIYKAVHTDTHDWSESQPSEQAYRDAYEKKTNEDVDYSDIISFIELINDTPDETFAHELGRVFDVAAYLDYYAITVLISNGDYVHHNVYLLHDSNTGRWELVPYDFDVTFIQVERSINEGTAASPIQPRDWASVLLTRVLDVPQFRAYYCHRLAEFMDTIFSDAATDGLIDETYATIEQDGLRDWHKAHREDNAWFVAGPDEIKTYVTRRSEFLWGEMPAYCPAYRPYLGINEVMVDNRTILEDPDEPGEFPAWFEIHNEGLEAVDLSGMYLTNDLADPTRFQIASGVTIPPSGFITFFADGDPEQGPGHTNFRLSEKGGDIGIFSGTQQIDTRTFGSPTTDRSEGRHPDGAGRWTSFDRPTPGSSNLLLPPVISDATRTIPLPTAADVVTVEATISDDGVLLTPTLHYSATGSGFAKVGMISLGPDSYAAQIPTQPSGSLVEYYVSAEDDDRQTSTSPRDTYIVDYRPPALFINELVVDNETTLGDTGEPGQFPDWIELYNPGPDSIDLGGRYLTDDPNAPTKFRIADEITIPAGGFLVFYADDSSEEGPYHANFKLSKDGESVGLFDSDATGNHPIDVYTFGLQPADRSEGRCPDGGTWISFAAATPGAANEPCGRMPVISKVGHTPPVPSATDQVTVTAVVVGDDASAVIPATLWYNVGSGFLATPMTHVGDNLYAATIPAQPDGTRVAYYIRVASGQGLSATAPPEAQVDAYRYLVGYRPPPLFISEFMADNVTVLEDPDAPGRFPDWIELHNPSPAPVDLGGKYLTDDLADPTKFRISDNLIIPGGGFVLFYADNDPEQGPFHTNFRLSGDGESIGLFDSDVTGNQPIHTYTFGLQVADMSERRYSNGGDTWVTFRVPTPGWADVPGQMPYMPMVLK